MSKAKEDEKAPEEAPVADGFDRLDAHDASLAEFPSLHGQPAVEVQERTVDGEDGRNVHRKVFVLLAREFDLDGFDHEPNKRATVQYMVQHGLRPVGEVEFDGAKDLPDGRSVALVYTVQAVPAVIAEEDAAHLVVE